MGELNTGWKSMTRDERKAHFMKRLQERYGISITGEEYEDMCLWVRPENEMVEKCEFLLKISNNLRAFRLSVKRQDVLALYCRKNKALTTALPLENYYEPERMVPKIFRKKRMVAEAVEEYNKILETCCLEYVDLGDREKNWRHYSSNCTYPNLLMAECNGVLNVRKVYWQVLRNMEQRLGISVEDVSSLI
jgi:hypothetical protein